MSEPLFRFILTRPPAQSPLRRPAVNLAQNSNFQGALKQAAKETNPLQALRAVAADFLKTPTFIGDPTVTPLSDQLAALSQLLGPLQLQEDIARDDLVKVITKSFSGRSPTQIIEESAFEQAEKGLKDSLLAIKHLQEEHLRSVEDLSNQLRVLDLVAIVASADAADLPTTGTQLTALMKRPFLIDLNPITAITSTRALSITAQRETWAVDKARLRRAQDLVDEVESHKAVVAELIAVNSAHIVSMPQQDLPALPPASELKPKTSLLRQANFHAQLSGISLKKMDSQSPSVATLETGETTAAAAPALDPSTWNAISHFADTVLKPPTFFSSGAPPLNPADKATTQLKLTPEKIRALSSDTTEFLARRGIPLVSTALDDAVGQVKSRMARCLVALNEMAAPHLEESISLKTYGGTTVAIRNLASSSWAKLVVGGRFPTAINLVTDTRIPHTRGNVSPAGVADLFVVKQQLKRYEGADISTIVDVLEPERREQEHTATRTATSRTSTQTEMTNQPARDLESASRFEMSKETENTIKSDQSLKAGLNISASYGPTLTLSTSVEGSLSSTRSEATEAAAKFSQNVTEKSSKSIANRVLQTTLLTAVDEVVRNDSHSYGNSNSAGNISGVYQWVTKVYEAQVFNYGLRVMYDFMIPEPAAFIIEVLKQAQASAVRLDRPPDLAITAEELDEHNFRFWASVYGATDVSEPPEEFKTYAKEIAMPPTGSHEGLFNKTDEIVVDAGYRALSVVVVTAWGMWEDDAAIDVGVGCVFHRWVQSSGWAFQSSMNDESGSIPVWMKASHASQAVVGIEVKAVRTDRAVKQWALETYGKIWNAHKARMDEYNKALHQLQLEAGAKTTGRSPEANLATMRSEIKKNCISILTDQHYDAFDSIDVASSGLPQIDIYQSEAEGAYVRFFEQAFEWEEMTWLTYPYFWGRKKQWPSRIAFSDPDPAFEDFLKAGYCRAVAPVRPGFETAIDHFLKYGELWNGGPLPPISDRLYVPIANELAERLGRPATEKPQGDPWDVRVPTTLVRLRKDGSLPTWTKQPDGTWRSNDS